MRKFLVGLSMLFLGGFVSAQDHPKESAEDLLEKTVQITIYYKPLFTEEEYKYNLGGICAGVWVGNKHVLTAAHCVNNNKLFPGDKDNSPVISELYEVYIDTAENVNSSGYAAKVQRVAFRRDCDLSVLRVVSPFYKEHEIASMRQNNLSIGEKVTTVGHPGKFAWVHTSGEVASLNYLVEEEGLVNVININIGHGNSGGGLFDSNNKLVGITQAISESGDERLAFYTTQNCIRAVLNDTKESETKKNREW